MKTVLFNGNPVIFTTGAFLKPLKITNQDGKEIWIWYVTEFEEDSFLDGAVFNPEEFADTKENLLKEPVFDK